MKHLKLLDGLKILDREEWISYRKYILMHCTKASDNYKLLDYLYSIREELTEVSNIDQIKNPLFSKMSLKAFSNLMSRIFNWYEEWIIWFENNKDEILQDIQLVKIYNRRGAYKLANKTYRRVEKKLLAEEQLDLDINKNLYLLHRYHYYSDNPIKYKRKGEILETLITYFLYQFKEQALLYVTELHNWGTLQNHDYYKEIELLTQIGPLIDDSDAIEVIEMINRLVKDLDEKAFLELRKVIRSNQIKKDSELYILASMYMITFSLRLWNNNKISDPQYVIDAYDFGLDSGVLLSSGKIPFVRFMNLLATLGYIRTTTKTYEFIDKWVHLVESENQESAHALGYAQLKLIEGKCDDLIPLLIGKKFETESGKLRSSSIELVGLYTDRKTNYSIMANRINNFKRVLKTYDNKGDDFSYKLYINFVKVLELLVKRDFIKLNINLDNYAPILHKKWLEDEIKAGQK